MAKEILYINLNYTHHNLSPKIRIETMVTGIIMLSAGICCTIWHDGNIFALVSGILNIAVGLIGFLFAQRRLPDFAKKFIRLSENSIKIKNSWFIPRRKFIWDDIDKIEITRENLLITTDYSSRVKSFDLMSVSYEDYNTLHKLIVDNCLERNIDMI